jgi:predicted ATPase
VIGLTRLASSVLGALVGRDRVVQEFHDPWRASRPVTIIGPDGVGTTVLARAGALRDAAMFTMGAAYVDLAHREEAGAPAAAPD